MFLEVSVFVLVATCSNHCPLFLSACRGIREKGGIRKKNFKYELSWKLEEGCKQLIAEEWCKGIGV